MARKKPRLVKSGALTFDEEEVMMWNGASNRVHLEVPSNRGAMQPHFVGTEDICQK